MKSENYKEFIDKFKPKLTTDDCYTPQPVYDVVLAYARRIGNIGDAEIVRPFYPGGDYKNADYSGGKVVVDNPPFSIFSQIVRWYQAHGVCFFLFAPHLTVFSARLPDVSYIFTNSDIIYQNGVKVKTAFITNMLSESMVIVDPAFAEDIKKANNSKTRTLPKYKYPDNVVTVSKLAQCADRGVRIEFPLCKSKRISRLDSQIPMHKACFGNALLVSNDIAKTISKTISKSDVIEFDLSERERKIINELK